MEAIQLDLFKESDRGAMLQGMELIRHMIAGKVGNMRHAASKLPEEEPMKARLLRDAQSITEILQEIGTLSENFTK